MVPCLQRFLQEHGEVQLSALGLGLRHARRSTRAAHHTDMSACLAAISSMVTVAEILKNNKLANEQSKLVTSTDIFNALHCALIVCVDGFRNLHGS